MARSAYIHIPFCSHKCDFCDFAAFAGVDELEQEYCRIVAREIEERLQAQPNNESLSTVFFGGGTPGYVDPESLALILEALKKNSGIKESAEITLETTPQTISKEKCRSWIGHGIKRISIGIESMSDLELKAMGRDHTRQEAIRGVEAARNNGYENIALDLMYGLPEQTLASWEKTLDDLLSFEPEHISAYGLTIAQNSPLLLRYPRDSNSYPDEECFEKMYYMLVEKCAEKNLVQYEIANFAKAGFESQHNLSYWKNLEYLAFGVSAHRYFKGKRSSNFRSLKRYMREFKTDETSEDIDEKTRAKEAIFLGLRLREGLNLLEYKSEYGIDLMQEKGAKISMLCQEGFLTSDNQILKLSQRGVLVSNTVLAELI